MSFEKVEDPDEPLAFDYCPICPKCYFEMAFTHDLKCQICDNKRTVYCPKCETHYRLKI